MAELPPLDAKNRLHRVFQQFLGVFTRKEHPLVLFLDDLQWVDAASLQLIQYLLTNEDTRSLMLIAAYRDNEVDATHPLQSCFTEIRQSGAAVADIQLASLPMDALNQLTADTLHAPASYCEPLTQLIYEKTGGNPFFFTQFLASLQKEGLLRYVPQDKRWHWNTERIGVKDFADNVVNLMLEKLQRLPAPTRKLLQLGACLGNKFDLRQLALVSRAPAREIEQRLGAAFHEGLIVAIDGACKFLHDRIQQAAYSLISPNERSATHLRIGRMLHAALSEDKTDSHLFDIANQFNLGPDQLADPKEKEQVAALNLRAGKKAKASAAYASACVYLAAGMALLEEKDWERRYELMFGLWLERASCEFLTGHFDEAAQLIAVLLQRGASTIDLTAAYRLKILLHVVKSENPQAVDSGIACLRLFGIDLPPHPTDQQVQAEYEIMWRNLGNRPIENLIELPLMTDPDMQTVTNVLSDLINPAVFTDMNFTRLLYCHIVSLSLKHGIASSTAYGYVVLGTLLGSEFHRYHDGYRFVRLAVDLVEKHGFIAEQARTYFVMGLAAVWTQPIETALDYGQKAFRTGVETGDLTIACYSWIILTADALFRGALLEDVWRTSEEGLAFCRKNRFRDVADILISHQQFIKAMQGRTAALSTFNDAQFDEAAFEAQLTAERMQPMCYWYWCMKLQGRFIAGDYAGALTAAERTKALLWSTIGQVQTLYYHYYTALTITAVYQSSQGDAQRAWREQLATHQEQLREWAEIYPPTFRDKYLLVAAETARIDGRDLDAMRLYQQAIEAAHGGGFVQNEGVIHELAAGFYLGRGLKVAGYAHLAEARRCFAHWGAVGKIAQLEARYPQALLSSGLSAALSLRDAETQLDLLSVAKASQAISGRILLKELIDTLMRIVLENAGAQNGALLIVRNNELKLAAEARSSEQGVAVELHGGKTLPSSLAPASIVNYVKRSREQILLADVEQANPFSSEDSFARRRPKSILCLPILRRDALLGVLYLENNLVAHAFTPARLTMLELLASQAAISLENALLYEDLHLQEARIRRLVESNIIGVFFWHLNGHIQDANEAFLRLVGYSRQEVLSRAVLWTDLTPPKSQETDARKMEELKRTHSVMPYEKEFFRKDGRRIPVLIGATFLEGSIEQGIAFVLDLTKQKQAETRIRHMAHYDSLTGLPNRTLLQDRMKQTIAHVHRNDAQLAILFIDLDHFKHINDSLGHSIGDRLLQMAATRLQQCVREGDSVARLGGDEFVLSAPLPSIHHAALMAKKVLNALRLTFVIEGHELHINASIGIGLYPDDGTDVESLMRAADMAMYHAKEKGRGNYQFFTPALNKVAQQRLEVGNRLCQALARDEFMLYFQPQVNMETGKIFAAEALLRWRQPGDAPMSCGEFISIAEETGLILPIGEWVFAQACKRLKQWRDAGHSELRIAVNLSVRQFYQHDLPGVIERLLKEAGVPANALDLEITESVLLQRSKDNMVILQRLCDMGIQLSVDDFGTGYSSLAYLQRFPIHALKVDQSFVRDIGQDAKHSALVAAIIAMAHSMHLNVLAEGVETEHQAAFLLSHGCLAGQGFYYGEAAPADMFIKMLDKQSVE
ncbi:MAG TPA: EAL domain-containing protein [Burkholderiales bacterium]|nr:EAL domain-containing protein [Burkholderiales bacterium]